MCTYIQAKLSVIILIILEASVYDERVLSEGFMSGRSLCPDVVMYGGGFVRRGFCPGFIKTTEWLLDSIDLVKYNYIFYNIYMVCHILVIIYKCCQSSLGLCLHW